jgi:hypothetical protein
MPDADHTLDSQLADWIDIALACYLADRLAMRMSGRDAESGKQWSRVFNLTVPVREKAHWANVEIKGLLERLLHCFTEDAWHIEFVERVGPRRPAESQGFLLTSSRVFQRALPCIAGGLIPLLGLPSR